MRTRNSQTKRKAMGRVAGRSRVARTRQADKRPRVNAFPIARRGRLPAGDAVEVNRDRAAKRGRALRRLRGSPHAVKASRRGQSPIGVPLGGRAATKKASRPGSAVLPSGERSAPRASSGRSAHARKTSTASGAARPSSSGGSRGPRTGGSRARASGGNSKRPSPSRARDGRGGSSGPAGRSPPQRVARAATTGKQGKNRDARSERGDGGAWRSSGTSRQGRLQLPMRVTGQRGTRDDDFQRPPRSGGHTSYARRRGERAASGSVEAPASRRGA